MKCAEERIERCPRHWETKKLKFHFSRVFGGGTPSKDNETFWLDGDIPWVSAKDMKSNRIVGAIDTITKEAISFSATNMVKKGSVLMVVRSGILKHSIPIAINTVDVAINQDLKAFVLKQSLSPDFFVYWVRCQQTDLLLEWSQLGATVDSLDLTALLNTYIALPPPEEQRKIIDFLDHEVAEINRIINMVGGEASVRNAEEGTFLDLLSERRRALITAAVTGQINVDTYGKTDTNSATLDRIEEEMQA